MTHDAVEYDFRKFPLLSLPHLDPALRPPIEPAKHTLWFPMHKKVFERDGINCVVCGECVNPGESLTSIIPDSHYPQVHSALVDADYLLQQELGFVEKMARNSIVMCPTHQTHFTEQRFYIRYFDTTNQFITISHFLSNATNPDLESYNGQIVRLDPAHKLAPPSCFFLYHESLVRSAYPNAPGRTRVQLLPPRPKTFARLPTTLQSEEERQADFKVFGTRQGGYNIAFQDALKRDLPFFNLTLPPKGGIMKKRSAGSTKSWTPPSLPEDKKVHFKGTVVVAEADQIDELLETYQTHSAPTSPGTLSPSLLAHNHFPFPLSPPSSLNSSPSSSGESSPTIRLGTPVPLPNKMDIIPELREEPLNDQEVMVEDLNEKKIIEALIEEPPSPQPKPVQRYSSLLGETEAAVRVVEEMEMDKGVAGVRLVETGDSGEGKRVVEKWEERPSEKGGDRRGFKGMLSKAFGRGRKKSHHKITTGKK